MATPTPKSSSTIPPLPSASATSPTHHARRASVASNRSVDRLSGGGGSGRSTSTHRTAATSLSRSGTHSHLSPHQDQLHQNNPHLFEPSGAAASRRALLYDVERHKLEALPLTRLFRFLADRPHWLTDSSSGSTRDAQSEVPSGAGGRGGGGGGGGGAAKSESGLRMKAVVRSLVVAQPEGGRHVSKRQRDIDRARLASVLADRHDDLIIPDTIVWEASIPRGWFFTAMDGSDGGRATVQRRNVDIAAIERQWTAGLAPHAVAACFYTIAERDPAASVADKDTPLLQYQFLRACELSRFLHVQATQTSGSDCAAILQQFAAPLHAHNVVIQAVWSPRVLNITIRQNVNALHDDRLDANSRACTFEGSPHLSLELRPTTRLYGQVESAIHSLTKHFAAVDLKHRIVRLVAYFKVDKQSQLNLLYVPSVRVLRTALIERPVGVRSSPFFSAFRVALDVAVEYETMISNINFAKTDGNNKNSPGGSHDGSGGGGSPSQPHSQEPVRIRKSKADPLREKAGGNFEGSRLLADALDLSLKELNMDLAEQNKFMAQVANKKPAAASESPDRAGGSVSPRGGGSPSSSLLGRRNSPASFFEYGGGADSSSGGGGAAAARSAEERAAANAEQEEQERYKQSLQYQLDHSPVIENQRVELVEIVLDILEASPSLKVAAQALTRSYRHAATPAARDALRWAGNEAGLVCIDDGYGHLHFEPGPELKEEERQVLLAHGKAETLEDDPNDGSRNLDAKEDGGGPLGSGRMSNGSMASGGGGIFTPASNYLDSPHSHGITHGLGASALLTSEFDALGASGGSDGPSLPLLTSPSASCFEPAPLQASPSMSRAAVTLRASMRTVLGSGTMRKLGATHVPCWKDVGAALKTAVADFVYELSAASESGLGAVLRGAGSCSSSVAVSSKYPECVADLPGVSNEAARVCAAVLAACQDSSRQKAAADAAVLHAEPKTIAAVVGLLWPEVRLRDAVAIVVAGACGLLHLPDDVRATEQKSRGDPEGEQAVSMLVDAEVIATAQPGMSMLRVRARNSSQMNTQCVFRKAIGDTILALHRNPLMLENPQQKEQQQQQQQEKRGKNSSTSSPPSPFMPKAVQRRPGSAGGGGGPASPASPLGSPAGAGSPNNAPLQRQNTGTHVSTVKGSLDDAKDSDFDSDFEEL